MKINHLLFGLFVFSCVCSSQVSFAQKDEAKTKELKKKWKDKKDDMSLEDFKLLLEEREQLQGETEGLRRNLVNMKQTLDEKDNEVARLKGQIDELNGNMSTAGMTDSNEIDTTPKKKHAKGLLYRIQVGAFTKTDFSQYDGNNSNFTAEKDGEIIKYILGYFSSLEEAKNFKAYLQSVGVKDAWIVGYQDGTRVSPEEQQKLNN
jgi:hypothetical protein